MLDTLDTRVWIHMLGKRVCALLAMGTMIGCLSSHDQLFWLKLKKLCHAQIHRGCEIDLMQTSTIVNLTFMASDYILGKDATSHEIQCPCEV